MFRRRVFKFGNRWKWVLYVKYAKQATKIDSGISNTRKEALLELKFACKRYRESDQKLKKSKEGKYKYKINYLNSGIKSFREFSKNEIVQAMKFMDEVNGELTIYESA